MRLRPRHSLVMRRALVIAAACGVLFGCGRKTIVLEPIEEIQKGRNTWRVALEKRQVWWQISFDPYGVMPSSAIDVGAGAVPVRWSVENAGQHPIQVLVHRGPESKWRNLTSGETTPICSVPLSNLVYSTATFTLDSRTTNNLDVFLVLDSDAPVRFSRPIAIWACGPWP